MQSKTSMIREAQIKSALIDYFFSKGWISTDAVIINEMPVPAWTRRADLVVANGELIAFEIKSDGDKITRLNDQIKAYDEFFESVTVVTGPRHLAKVLAQTPNEIGLILALPSGDGVKLEVKRNPQFKSLRPESAIRLMSRVDLAKAAKSAGHRCSLKTDRATLEKIAWKLSPKLLREEALSAVKRRYVAYHQIFKSTREMNGETLSALNSLKKPSWNAGNATSPTKSNLAAGSQPNTKLRCFWFTLLRRLRLLVLGHS